MPHPTPPNCCLLSWLAQIFFFFKINKFYLLVWSERGMNGDPRAHAVPFKMGTLLLPTCGWSKYLLVWSERSMNGAACSHIIQWIFAWISGRNINFAKIKGWCKEWKYSIFYIIQIQVLHPNTGSRISTLPVQYGTIWYSTTFSWNTLSSPFTILVP